MTGRPHHLMRRRCFLNCLIDRLGNSASLPWSRAMDILSDVLKTVRLTGAAFFDVNACDPWVAEQPTREMVLSKVLAGAQHLISYHVVIEGGCYASILDGAEAGEPIAVKAGEV